jgi:hypothetical protein
MGAIDMGLAEELTLAEAITPLMAFRYKSFDVAATMIDFETAVIAGLFTKPDYQFRSLIGLANAGNAPS